MRLILVEVFQYNIKKSDLVLKMHLGRQSKHERYIIKTTRNKIQKKCKRSRMIYPFEQDCMYTVLFLLYQQCLSRCWWGGGAGFVFLSVTTAERPLWWSQRPPYADPLGRWDPTKVRLLPPCWWSLPWLHLSPCFIQTLWTGETGPTLDNLVYLPGRS